MFVVFYCYATRLGKILSKAHLARVALIGMFMAQDEEDPYDVLLISRSATAAEVRKSYQELARKVAFGQPVGFSM